MNVENSPRSEIESLPGYAVVNGFAFQAQMAYFMVAVFQTKYFYCTVTP